MNLIVSCYIISDHLILLPVMATRIEETKDLNAGEDEPIETFLISPLSCLKILSEEELPMCYDKIDWKLGVCQKPKCLCLRYLAKAMLAHLLNKNLAEVKAHYERTLSLLLVDFQDDQHQVSLKRLRTWTIGKVAQNFASEAGLLEDEKISDQVNLGLSNFTLEQCKAMLHYVKAKILCLVKRHYKATRELHKSVELFPAEPLFLMSLGKAIFHLPNRTKQENQFTMDGERLSLDNIMIKCFNNVMYGESASSNEKVSVYLAMSLHAKRRLEWFMQQGPQGRKSWSPEASDTTGEAVSSSKNMLHISPFIVILVNIDPAECQHNILI